MQKERGCYLCASVYVNDHKIMNIYYVFDVEIKNCLKLIN